MLWLVFTRQGKLERQPLADGDTFVGRAETCDVVLDHPSVSRQHARLRVRGGSCVVTDLDSLNGTYLNGEGLSESCVAPDDWLAFGEISAQVQVSVDEEVALLGGAALPDGAVSVRRDAPPPGRACREGEVATVPAGDASRWLALLSEMARLLVGSHATGRLLERVADLALNHIARAERVVVVERQAVTGELVPRVLRRRGAADRTGAQVGISRTVAAAAIDERSALLTVDVRVDERLGGATSALAMGVGSLMCAPLWRGDEPFGVLYVDAPRETSLDALDLDLLVALANFTSAVIEQSALTERVSQEMRLRERLQRYHSPAVVTRILEVDPARDGALIAAERDVTVVFADIVGFTRIAERASPAAIAILLNRYFERLTDAIFDCEGTVDKFIGDAVLAVFGAPFPQPDHAWRAVRAARAMRRAVDVLNASHPDERLDVKLSINSGIAIVGDIGSSRRREFTVLGDVVNIASRIESEVARPSQIVMTLDTRRRLSSDIDVGELGPVRLRGRSEPVVLFELLGQEPVAPS